MSANAVHRVCHVCAGHPADDARVFRRSCATLAESGYEVHLIAMSNAAETYVQRGVTIHPLPSCGGLFERISRRRVIGRMAADVNADLYHVHEPELLGPVLSIAGTRPVVYDVHESYLDVITDHEWIPKCLKPLARPVWDAHERRMLKRCAAVVAVTDQVAARYLKLHRRVILLANYPELDDMLALSPDGRDGRTCVFTGTLHANRGLYETIAAIAILRGRGLDVPLAIAGSGLEGLVRGILARASDLAVEDLVTYKGVLSRDEAIALANSASIGLVPHLAQGNNLAAWPVKMMEYMALGLPIVYSNLPSHGTIAADYGLGISVDPSHPEAIADAIERLVRDSDLARQMGEAGRSAALTVFNWGAEKSKLVDLYRELIGGPCDKAS